MAKRKRAGQPKRNGRMWVRLGDGGEYESFDGPFEAGEHVGQYTSDREPLWLNLGVALQGFTGQNYISLFWGDRDAQPGKNAALTPGDRSQFIAGMKAAEPVC